MAALALWSQLLLLGLGSVGLASPIDGSQKVLHAPETLTKSRKLNGRFLHITDFHPDPFYKVHTSTEQGIACHRGKGVAGTYGAETTDCDSPYSLVNATFDWLAQNVKDDIDFVVWTGDSARHDSDEKHPRHADEVMATNRMIADKFVETFSSDKNSLDVPVIPTWGNNDFLPHNIFYPGPNKWLRKYSDIWRRFIPEAQRHSFEYGGWFWVEVVPNRLAVFSLNTMYLFDRNAGVDGCASPSEPGYQHMDWLRVQLQMLRERGMKAILIGHVPPARTDSKQNWDETCWQKYALWLKQYRDVVTGSLFGHMNIDHFLLQDAEEINIKPGTKSLGVRESLDGEISVASKEDYLRELREEWNKIPGSIFKGLAEEVEEANASGVDPAKKKKKDKYKEIGGKYGERYSISLISPSIVPNYFPTIRVIEYNITGVEDAALWVDSFDGTEPAASPLEELEEEDDSPEDLLEELRKRDLNSERKKKKKKKKGKGKKPAKPNDPNLIVPADPPKGSTPGPAYSPQPFTLTGYTQYFANLTHINNDIEDSGFGGSKWHDGDYSGEDPKHKDPKPNEFKFEVEYSTFDDKIYKLDDLTVMSYLKLAYRMCPKKKGKSNALSIWDDDFEDDEDDEVNESLVEFDEEGEDSVEDEVDDDEFDSEDDDMEPQKKKKKGKKKKKNKNNKKKHSKNKTWLHFLDRAFVGTVSKKGLEKIS
ncbi:Endopolyphosphatase [Amphichorda felina]